MEITDRTITLTGSIIFDNLRTHICPSCGSIHYFYDNDRLTFISTHRNTLLHEGKFYFVPRCQRCEAEFNHMLKAVELMKRSGD